MLPCTSYVRCACTSLSDPGLLSFRLPGFLRRERSSKRQLRLRKCTRAAAENLATHYHMKSGRATMDLGWLWRTCPSTTLWLGFSPSRRSTDALDIDNLKMLVCVINAFAHATMRA